MDDNSIMPFGKYKGEKLANVPAGYLLWLFDNGKAYGQLRDYIHENHDAIELEIKKECKHKKGESNK